jgi:hypothetical protein
VAKTPEQALDRPKPKKCKWPHLLLGISQSLGQWLSKHKPQSQNLMGVGPGGVGFGGFSFFTLGRGGLPAGWL